MEQKCIVLHLYIIGKKKEDDEMSYSLSLEMGARGKMTAKNRGAMIAHTYRKQMKQTLNHSNEKIDSSRTKNNIDVVFNKHENGTMMTLDEAIDHRLENEYSGKRKVRKDAVLVRELIVQADPEIYDGLSDKQKKQKATEFTNDTLRFMSEEFGSKNVMAASLHLDEDNPHTHIAIMPMTKDGRLSQKDFFKSPADMRMKHERYRSFMNERGWNFDLENKYEDAKHVKTEAYKKNAKQIEADRQAHTDEIRRAKQKPDIRNEAKRELKDELRGEVYEEAYQEALQNANNRVLSDFNAKREKDLEEREKALKSKENDVLKREQEAIKYKNSYLTGINTFNETMNEVAHVLPAYDGKLRDRTQTILDRNLEPTPQSVTGTVYALARNVSNNSMKAIQLINNNMKERNNQMLQQQPKQQDEGIEL